MQAKNFPTYPESTLAFFSSPYTTISSRCRRLGVAAFQTRVLLQPTVCMTGQDAAEAFYDESRFQRRGAAPSRLQKTLFGRGGVQGLDGEAHRHRKAMFMSLMSPTRVSGLVDLCDQRWERLVGAWENNGRITLYDEMNELLCWSACRWAGVPLPEEEVPQRTGELVALFQYAGSWGPVHWWSRRTRQKTNRWIQEIVEQARAGGLELPIDSAADVVTRHRNLNGELLAPHDAAVEIINLLRPIVAVSVFVVLAALALNDYEHNRRRLQADDDYVEPFVQEVRRYYPFFPFAAAVVRRDFVWNGYKFPEGYRVLLDLYGTNRDADVWKEPHEFRPERFMTDSTTPFNFIPQGGGEAHTTHRCPGEPATIEIMKWATKKLTRGIAYNVPPQDLGLQMSRTPALPASRLVMQGVRRLG